MDNDLVPQRTLAWLTDGVLKSSYQAYSSYLVRRGNSSWTVRKYLCSVAHFAYWLQKRRFKLSQIDEALIRHFLDEHLPLQTFSGLTSAPLSTDRYLRLVHEQLALRCAFSGKPCGPMASTGTRASIECEYRTHLRKNRSACPLTSQCLISPFHRSRLTQNEHAYIFRRLHSQCLPHAGSR
jgi:hypothetical protein